MKVHRELTPKWTMEHVTKFRYKISKIIGVLHSTLYLCTIEKGCIQLRYQLPCSVAAVVFPLTIEQEVALRAEGVHKLRCAFGENCYEFPVERAEPKVTLANSRPPTLESAHLTVTEHMRGRPSQVVAGHENLDLSVRALPFDSQSASNSKASVISTDRHFTNFIRMFMTAQLKEQGCTTVLNQVPDYEDLGDKSQLALQYISQLEEEWQQEFEVMVRQLELTEENLKFIYVRTVREMFKDRIHWGLIVTFLVFSSAFAVFCVQNWMESRVGDVVAWTEAEMQRMNEWMIQNGGWEAFVETLKQCRRHSKSTAIDIPRQSASNSKASVISTDRHFTNFFRMFMTAQLKEQGCTSVLNQVPDYEDLGDKSQLALQYIYVRTVRESFREGIDWGKISAFLVFSSAFAVFCAQNRKESRVGDVVAWTEAENE